MSSTEAQIEQELNRFVALYQAKTKLKVQTKQVNSDYNESYAAVKEFLATQPGNARKVNSQYTVRLAPHKKAGGINMLLIGEGYVNFNQNAGGRAVGDTERDAFLETLKTLKKSKTSHGTKVNIITT